MTQIRRGTQNLYAQAVSINRELSLHFEQLRIITQHTNFDDFNTKTVLVANILDTVGKIRDQLDLKVRNPELSAVGMDASEFEWKAPAYLRIRQTDDFPEFALPLQEVENPAASLTDQERQMNRDFQVATPSEKTTLGEVLGGLHF